MILRRAFEHPGWAEPRHAGTRQQRVGSVVALPEGEHVEPAVARLQRVGVLEREMHEAVTRAHRIPLDAVAVVLNGDPVAGEHVEDLLLRALEMQRRAPTAGLDRDALDADGDRVGPVSERHVAAI